MRSRSISYKKIDHPFHSPCPVHSVHSRHQLSNSTFEACKAVKGYFKVLEARSTDGH